jgi:hypothetical protein
VLTRPAFVADETVRLSGDRQALAVAGFFTLLVLVMYISMGTRTTPGLRRRERSDQHHP